MIECRYCAKSLQSTTQVAICMHVVRGMVGKALYSGLCSEFEKLYLSIFHLQKFPDLKRISILILPIRSATYCNFHSIPIFWHLFFPPLAHVWKCIVKQCFVIKIQYILLVCILWSFWHVTGIDDQSKWIYTTISATTKK